MDNILEKKIQIVDLKPQFVPALNKNKYFIKGNDGINYEFWDLEIYSNLKIGQWVTIKYVVKTNQAKNGKMYTNYIIQLPRKPQSQGGGNQGGGENFNVLNQVMTRMAAMEKNIIDAIRIHCGEDVNLNPENVPDAAVIEKDSPFLGDAPINGDVPVVEDTNNNSGFSESNPF